MADEKKGITVKIDADLHAEIREYLERHEGMTMAEFITLAVDDELHPKIQQKEDEEAAENGFAGECEGDNSSDEETDTETEDEDESEGFGMTM